MRLAARVMSIVKCECYANFEKSARELRLAGIRTLTTYFLSMLDMT